MSTFTSITKIIKQSLKTQKRRLTQFHNKQAFNIFHVATSFANILTTAKIAGKKTHAGKKIFIFEHLEAAI